MNSACRRAASWHRPSPNRSAPSGQSEVTPPRFLSEPRGDHLERQHRYEGRQGCRAGSGDRTARERQTGQQHRSGNPQHRDGIPARRNLPVPQPPPPCTQTGAAVDHGGHQERRSDRPEIGPGQHTENLARRVQPGAHDSPTNEVVARPRVRSFPAHRRPPLPGTSQRRVRVLHGHPGSIDRTDEIDRDEQEQPG